MLVVGVVVPRKCSKYVCRHPADPANLNVCTLSITDAIGEELTYIGNCATPGDICHFDSRSPNGGTCHNTEGTVAYPGEKQKNYTTCVGTFIDGYCRGRALGEQCSATRECDLGLYCASGACAEGNDRGSYCTDNQECKSYLVCHGNICVYYGSIRNGYMAIGHYPELCESGYMVDRTCMDGPKLVGKILVDDRETVCQYSNGETKPALCGHHTGGKAICLPGAGDVLPEWRIIVAYTRMHPQCISYQRRYSICDYGEKEFGKAYYRAVIAFFRKTYMDLIQSSPECLENNLVPDYYEALRKYNGATSISVLFGLAIAILVLI